MLKISILTLKISFACSFGGKLTNILHFKTPKLFRLFFGQVHECFRSALACIHSRCDILFTGLSTLSPFISHSLFLSLSLSLPLSSPIYGQGTIVFSKDIKIYSREWRGWGLSPLIKRENVIRLTRGTLQVGFVCCFSYYASLNMIFLTFCHSRRNLIWS